MSNMPDVVPISAVVEGVTPTPPIAYNGSPAAVASVTISGAIKSESESLSLWRECLLGGMMRYLSLPELFALAKVDYFRRDCVKTYLRFDGPVWAVLRHFFLAHTDDNADDVLTRVRRVLMHTDSVLSGSAVLSMITGVLFDGADMDWFVTLSSRDFVIAFLEREGYTFQEELWKNGDYTGIQGVVSVKEFVRGYRRVQVVSVTGSAIEAIVGFHSTVVCNVFTSTHLICLYAKETIESKINIAMTATASKSTTCRALLKYDARGWPVRYAMTDMSGADERTRRIGDQHCLVYRHSEGWDGIIGMHSWIERVRMHKLVIVKRIVSVCDVPYLVSPDLVAVYGTLLRGERFRTTPGSLHMFMRTLFFDSVASVVLREHHHDSDCEYACELSQVLMDVRRDVKRIVGRYISVMRAK
ncbi:hypothetical protein CYLTODRAFT_412835 [Cylindrobasidium torrendii FP15055 ss-10]|uniref:Uncharacterized protein n=1 Tax=Cylindrobasidium torrendii FP15055 ss-10 TaxID=1314674 RepID=A0A0D7B6F5_9AGAR|nr:hypothetical protein CYLTODRAFT_412835 [Cylindrobasidium torrendii FP15055 ss-10]